ncbi:hypothetical protein LshimejAT787_0200680 [Lyophyllum shimeji]|uniref:F-box domain-containing protein n=1 Tax=Lyophyllum shimeji TaxID=47721 RepID=A0A9P3PFK0_LYOSH|nr:hypothetical protein LshimejAT787_0200680 [Lyophyllum shimeji]
MSIFDQRRQAANVLLTVRDEVSSLAHLLQTNDPPSDSEVEQIVPLLRAVDNEIARFKPQDIDPNFKAIVYDPLKSLHAALRGALSALRSLPSEILSQIFSACMPVASDDHDGTSWNNLDITSAPWTLVQVSRRWRETALADQKLWSRIKVDSWALAAEGKPEPTPPKLVACLARSGEHPLSIDFRDRYPSIFGSNLPLLTHLMAYAERWTFLKLAVSFKYLEFMSPIKGRLPELQELVIQAAGPSTFSIYDVFEVAPNLRSAALAVDDPSAPLSISAAFLKEGPHIIKLPWAQLTSLAIDSFEVLAHAPQLLSCQLNFTSSSHAPRNHPVVKHTAMRTLFSNLASILNFLETPSLESLTVFSGGEVDALSQIVAFLSRSSCPLKFLHLIGLTVKNESDLRLLLQLVPTLVSLEISFGSVAWNMVARTLTITPQSHLAPNLATISFSFAQTDVDPEILLRTLESRCMMQDGEDTKRLRHLALFSVPSTPRGQLMLLLRRLEELGLKVTTNALGDRAIEDQS